MEERVKNTSSWGEGYCNISAFWCQNCTLPTMPSSNRWWCCDAAAWPVGPHSPPSEELQVPHSLKISWQNIRVCRLIVQFWAHTSQIQQHLSSSGMPRKLFLKYRWFCGGSSTIYTKTVNDTLGVLPTMASHENKAHLSWASASTSFPKISKRNLWSKSRFHQWQR